MAGRYELSYSVLMPTIINYYVIDGQGYNFKFGGGLGLRFASINEFSNLLQIQIIIVRLVLEFC